jgi:hypothetical protein
MSFRVNVLKLGLALAAFLAVRPIGANVLPPPVPPATPAGYYSTISTELQGYLDTFNQTLGTPAPFPTIQGSQLQMADSS